jgi:hypothetical protein
MTATTPFNDRKGRGSLRSITSVKTTQGSKRFPNFQIFPAATIGIAQNAEIITWQNFADAHSVIASEAKQPKIVPQQQLGLRPRKCSSQ